MLISTLQCCTFLAKMLPSDMALIRLFIGLAMISSIQTSTRITLNQNGYSNILFAVSPDVPPSESEKIIENIKLMVQEASAVLSFATRNYAFFYKDIRILIPESWDHIQANSSTWETWQTADVRIGPPAYGDKAYTEQVGGCGVPGSFIYFHTNYILTLNSTDNHKKYGRPGKVFVHEWSHLRYGVFDEYGEPGHAEFPLFHDQAPNLCTNAPPQFSVVDVVTNSSTCALNALGAYDANCRFQLNDNFAPVSSLLSVHYLDSAVHFCDGGQSYRHITKALNRQNKLCRLKPVWDVVTENQDFKSATPARSGLNRRDTADLSSNFTVTIVRPLPSAVRGDRYVLVLDVSQRMADCGRLTKMREAAYHWILNDLPLHSSLAIVKFSDKAHLVRDLVPVDAATRLELVKQIPSEVESYETCMGCGLEMAVQVLNKAGRGGHVVLITHGRSSEGFQGIPDVLPTILKAEVRVITICLGLIASPYLEGLADFTDGKSYFVCDRNSGQGITDALLGSLTFQPYVISENLQFKLYTRTFRLNWSQTVVGGHFFIDLTVGRNTEIRIVNLNSNLISSVLLMDPIGRKFNATRKLRSIGATSSVMIPSAATGRWTYEIHLNVAIPKELQVTVTTQLQPKTSAPINTECWFSSGSEIRNATNTTIPIYAKVTKKDCPVFNATIRAYIEKPNDEVEIITLEDKGVNSDITANDGIYSRYYTNATQPGRYTVTCQVVNDGRAYTGNGFIASYIPVRNEEPGLSVSEKVENFTRIVAAGSFRVGIPVSPEDAYPPGRVTDLAVTVSDITKKFLQIKWTAPGDDLDSGTVSRYEVKYSTDIDELNDHFDSKNHSKITEQDIVGGSFKPVKVGSIQTVVASVPFRNDVTYYAALRAIDKAGKKSSVSNIAQFYLASPLMTVSSEEKILSVEDPVPDEVVPDEVVPDEVVPDEVVPDEAVPEEIVELILEVQEDSVTQQVDVPASTEEEQSRHVTSTAVYVISTLSAVSVIVVIAAITRKIYRSQYRQYKNVPV